MEKIRELKDANVKRRRQSVVDITTDVVNFVASAMSIDPTFGTGIGSMVQLYFELTADTEGLDELALYRKLDDVMREMPLGHASLVAPRPELGLNRKIGLRYSYPVANDYDIDEGIFIEITELLIFTCDSLRKGVREFAD